MAWEGWFRYLSVVRAGKQLTADTALNLQKHHWKIIYGTHSETLALHSRMTTVLRRWALLEVSMAFHHWSNLCSVKRKILIIVAKHLQGSTHFYFEWWANWTVKMKTLARYTAARVVTHAKVIFDTWQLKTMRNKMLKEKCVRLMGVFTQNTSERCFQSWRYQSKLRILHKEIVMERMTAKNGKYERVTLQHWRAWAKRHAMITVMLTGMFVRRDKATVLERFGRWRWFVSMDKTGRAVAVVHARAMRKVLWVGWQVARKGERVRKVCQPSYTRQLLVQWKNAARYQRNINKIFNKVCGRWQRGSNREVFKSWLSYLDMLDEYKETALHCAQKKAYTKIFPTWSAHAKETLARRKKVQKMLIQVWRSFCTYTFEQWQWVAKRRTIRRANEVEAARHMWSWCLAKAMLQWEEFIAEQKLAMKKFGMAHKMAEKFTKQNFLAVWIDMVELRIKMRGWMEAVNLFQTDQTWNFVQKLVAAWKIKTKEKGAKALLTAAALRVWFFMGIAPAMNGWKAYTARMKKRKEVLVASMAKWDPAFQIANVFTGHDGYEAALKGSKVAMDHYILRSSVAIWREHVRTSRVIKNAVFQMGRGRELRFLKKCVDAWNVWIMLRRWVMKANGQADDNWNYKVPFKRWAGKTHKRKQNAEAARECQEMMKAALQLRVLKKWKKEYMKKVGFLVLRHGRCLSVQQQVVDFWSAHASESAALNKKLRKMMGKWKAKDLQEYFAAWATFLTIVRQMKMMLGKASHFLRPRMLRFLWDSFVTGIQKMVDTRKLLLLALTHDSQSVMLRSMILWRDWADRKYRRRELETVSDMFFLKRKLHNWKNWTDEKRAYEDKIFNTMKYWSRDTRRKYMLSWGQLVVKQRESKS